MNPKDAFEYMKEVSLPITNRFDDLFRGYLNDLVIICGVFVTLAGTFIIKEAFPTYPLLIKVSFLFCALLFTVVVVVAIYFRAKGLKELIPGTIHASKVGSLFSELSYLETARTYGEIEESAYTQRKNECLRNLKAIQAGDRSSGTKIARANNTQVNLNRVISLLLFCFVLGVVIFVSAILQFFSS